MTTAEVLSLLNKEQRVPKKMKDRREQCAFVYYGMSLHTRGILPRFDYAGDFRYLWDNNEEYKAYQWLFDNKLMARHPMEPDYTRQWRYQNYKALTKAAFSQIIEVVSGAIFQDSNYSIEIPDEQDNEYIWQNNFHGYDLVGYISTIGIRLMMEDPNGLFIRIPKAAWYEQSGGRVEVDIWFVHSKDILYFSNSELIFYKDDYAYYIDENTIWRYKKDANGKYNPTMQDREGYYAHLLGKLPVTVAGGEWNTKGYYDSFLDKAKPVADEFVSTFSAAQLVDKEASHPFITEVAPDCSECNGTGQMRLQCGNCAGSGCGECTVPGGGYGYIIGSCTGCGGKGINSQNPGTRLKMPKEEMEKGYKPVQIEASPISINQHHRETVKYLYEMLMEALYLKRVDKAESGEAKAIDLQRLHQFISKIANHLFDKIIHDTLLDIISYRNVSSTGGRISPASYPFYIFKPTQFQIETSADLLLRFETENKANIPAYIQQQAAIQYVDKAYSGNDVMKKKAMVINAIDGLSIKTDDQILTLRTINAIDQRQIVLHTNLAMWLDELIEEKGEEWFIKASHADIKTAITPKLDAMMPAVQTITYDEPETEQ